MITKKEINEATDVTHRGFNKYYYHYEVDNLVFRGDDLRITVEDLQNKPGFHTEIGFAENKKQFIDIVYDYLKV